MSAVLEGVRDKWDRTPLRVRLTAAVLVLVAGSLSLISVSTILALHSYFLGTVDDELQTQLTGWKPDTFGPMGAEDDDESPGLRPEQYLLSVVYPDGTREDRTSYHADLPAFDYEQVAASNGEAFTALSADGVTRWRVLGLPGSEVGSKDPDYVPEEHDLDPDAYYVLSYKLSHFDKTVAGLVWVDLLIGAGVLAGLAAIGVGLVRASLSPLRQIENTAAMIAAGNYSRRVPDHDPNTEVGRVGRAINSMLTKVEGAIRAREWSEQRAHDSEERMREFIADASHELRTPLTSVRGYAELVRTNPQMPEAERQQYVGQIEEAAKRMGLLVGDLLHLARLGQERPVETEPVDLAVLGHEAVAAHAVTAEDHEFRFTCVPGSSTVVAADRARMRQVLDNLLSNAVRHTPAGTHIDVEVAAEDASVRLTVADDGPGMTPEIAERVFERFFRSASNPGVSHPGSGLGLAIVAAIVKAHGGTVQVASEPGEGTAFTVVLTAEPPVDEPATDAPAD
ncbi:MULTISPECIES: sensor histidine kinase [Glycomyces]|uniref:histidine kinase n=2 Tax=Glycomyces TaxID=58113 RepID=A0A9X3SUR0_9ACTN|nr:HAMP domain-containing sensor histidine kinase [Glycomyces lechevalierae]MDA1385815.1 HAMP domain-containing sensor histidine kinase [Glycomyces lechevalierae]MDR7339935.1 two-component system OmpR family sensor kinase [Glycomyces lechevalierae]